MKDYNKKILETLIQLAILVNIFRHNNRYGTNQLDRSNYFTSLYSTNLFRISHFNNYSSGGLDLLTLSSNTNDYSFSYQQEFDNVQNNNYSNHIRSNYSDLRNHYLRLKEIPLNKQQEYSNEQRLIQTLEQNSRRLLQPQQINSFEYLNRFIDNLLFPINFNNLNNNYFVAPASFIENNNQTKINKELNSPSDTKIEDFEMEFDLSYILEQDVDLGFKKSFFYDYDMGSPSNYDSNKLSKEEIIEATIENQKMLTF